MDRALLGSCLLFVVAIAHADDLFLHPVTADTLQGMLDRPARLIDGAQVIRGQFAFRKFLSELPTPLESTGEYLIVKDLGIVWHTQQPFDSEFVVTPNGMLQREDGTTIAGTNADEQPGVRAAAHVLLSVLTLDVATLRSTFNLYGIEHGDRWQIGLRPIVPALQAIFRDAIIEGADQVETVVLHDSGGDHTQILFRNTRYDLTAPTASDRARFGQ